MKLLLLPKEEKKAQMDFSLAIVNIVLLLILFFLATGQLMNTTPQGVELSTTSQLEIENLPSPSLVVERGGAMVLNGEDIEADDLTTALAQETQLFVLIEGDAPAIDLLQVLAIPGMDRLEVKLVTLHSNGTEP